MVGPARFELATSWSQTTRYTKLSHDPIRKRAGVNERTTRTGRRTKDLRQLSIYDWTIARATGIDRQRFIYKCNSLSSR